MKRLCFLFLTLFTLTSSAQVIKRDLGSDKDGTLFNIDFKKLIKFSTVYGAVNGGTSISDATNFSVTSGTLQQTSIETPYDYSIAFGIRKIARFGYENKANTFYDGTETSYGDAATVGKVSGLEFLFEIDRIRQFGNEYQSQNHFLRYVADSFIVKLEYLQDGFADIEYFEASERYRWIRNNKLSFNVGAVQRLAKPYGYDPLDEWLLSNGNIHYTYLALQEGYTVNFTDPNNIEYLDPSGNVVANSTEVWEEIIIPQVIADYSERKINELEKTIQHSMVIGFDYYHYTKKRWLHAWGNIMPYHYDNGDDYSYHKYNNGEQWYDYSYGIIYGIKINKQLGYFVEGKYNRYWNREWYDFKLGVNYVIF